MAITYTTAVKAARMQAVVDAIDADASPGYIEIGTTGMGSVLATFTLSATSGTVSGAVLTFDMPKSDTDADNTGTAAEARIRDGAATDVVTGLTVGTAATDIVLDSVSITDGQTVTLSSGTFTHA